MFIPSIVINDYAHSIQCAAIGALIAILNMEIVDVLKKHIQICHPDKSAEDIDVIINAVRDRLRKDCINAMHAKYQALVGQLGYEFPKSN